MPTGGMGPVTLNVPGAGTWVTASGTFAAYVGPLSISGNCGSSTTASFVQGANGVVSLTDFQGNLPIPLQPTGDGSSATASNVTLFGRTDHTITVTIESSNGGTISAVNPAGGMCIAPWSVTGRNSCVVTLTASTCPTVPVGTGLCLPCTSPCPTTYTGMLFVAGRPTLACMVSFTGGTRCAGCSGAGAVPPGP
jgi:hypothetical protein